MASAMTVEEREAQKQYWMEHSAKPTVEAMMLDSKAAEIDQLERPEVRWLLHPYTYLCNTYLCNRFCNMFLDRLSCSIRFACRIFYDDQLQ